MNRGREDTPWGQARGSPRRTWGCWSRGPGFLLRLLTSGMADGACPPRQAWVAAGVSQGDSVISRCNDGVYSSGLSSRTQQDAPAKRSVSRADGFRLGVKRL